MRDTYHENKAVQALASASRSDSIAGPAIDLLGFNSALIVLNVGSIASGGVFYARIEESDTTESADFTAVNTEEEIGFGADAIGNWPEYSVDALVANSAYALSYIGSKRKRYIRVYLLKTGGTTIQLGAVAVLGHPGIAPTH